MALYLSHHLASRDRDGVLNGFHEISCIGATYDPGNKGKHTDVPRWTIKPGLWTLDWNWADGRARPDHTNAVWKG